MPRTMILYNMIILYNSPLWLVHSKLWSISRSLSKNYISEVIARIVVVCINLLAIVSLFLPAKLILYIVITPFWIHHGMVIYPHDNMLFSHISNINTCSLCNPKINRLSMKRYEFNGVQKRRVEKWNPFNNPYGLINNCRVQ